MKTLIAGFVIVASMTLSAQLPDFNSLTHKPLVSATSAPYNADPTGGSDSTTAIQNCINDTAKNLAICALPLGTYKISGAGLNMTPPNLPWGSLYGFQNLGVGTAQLVYYGSGTAITIGNCANPTSLVYGVNLVNIAIYQASGTTAQYGIQSCGLSEANWDGLSVGNGNPGGYFTGANIRFYESSEIDLLNLTVANAAPLGAPKGTSPYKPGTTGILFDNVYMDPTSTKHGNGNASITIHGGLSAIFAFQNAIVCKSCIDVTVRDALLEGNDYGLFVDNSTWNSPYNALDNVYFEGAEFLMDPQYGPTHNKVLQVNSTGGAKLVARNLVFRSTKWQLSGGVTFPVELNIPSTGPYSVFSLKLDTNSIDGATTAVVDSNNSLASIFFTGKNDITDGSGITRPADVHGKATVTDYAHPLAANLLTDSGSTNAIVTVPSPSNPDLGVGLVVTVPLANALQAGAKNTFTFELPISTCAPPSNPMVCTSTSAPASGTTVMITGLTGGWGGGNGTFVATNLSATTFSVPVNASGFPVSFSAFNPGWGNVLQIKSSFNPANNIATGYAATGTIVLFYNGKLWLDLKQ